jgi:cytochrome c biogenesis factor
MEIQLSVWAFIAAIACYAASSVWFILVHTFGKTGNYAAALRIFAAAALFNGLSVLLMWLGTGHGPYLTRFEVLSANILVAAALLIGVWIRVPRLHHLGRIAAPFLLLAAGVTFMQPKSVLPLLPSLKSSWLVIHVLFAKLAVGCLFIAFCLSVLNVARRDAEKGSDETIYKFTVSGFSFLTIMIVAGAIWARDAWGKYWGFDPIETWSLATWLLYGIYLHLRSTLGWKGRPLAIYGTATFLLAVFAYFIIPTVTETLHNAYMTR